MNTARLAYLLKAYFDKTATDAEVNEFMEIAARSEHDDTLKNLLTELWEQHSSQRKPFSENQGQAMLTAILQKGKVRKLRWLSAAAVIIVFIGGYLFIRYNNQSQTIVQATKQSVPAPIVPGGNKAILTLADGSHIELDSTRHGALGKQGNAYVVNLQSSVLTYDAGTDHTAKAIYNTLETPKGGQYKLVLADGTKVWLNASSSIRFPVAFNGDTRDVAITGEAYFEVAKDKTKPFTVTAKDAAVKVLGTHFNIMAYDDEKSMITTLVEGSVSVSKGPLQSMLKPGRQIKVKDEGVLRSGIADMEEVLAWKNGWFQFNSWDIQRIMRQIARWYDVEVVYEGKIPTGHYTGAVSRSNDINEALHVMQADGVGFRIEGHKITVYENR